MSQIAHIRQRQNGDAFFITGDFNNPLETSPEIVAIKNAGFHDSFRVLYPNATSVSLPSVSLSPSSLLFINHIIAFNRLELTMPLLAP